MKPTLLTEAQERLFWSKVTLPNGQGCMLWTGGATAKGYSSFRVGRSMLYAHRISYELAYGAVPAGFHVIHLKSKGCTARRCVAPLHLEAMSREEAIRRGLIGAHSRAKTHCPQGHPYDEANTHVSKRGERVCRKCRAAAARRRRAAAKVAQ